MYWHGWVNYKSVYYQILTHRITQVSSMFIFWFLLSLVLVILTIISDSTFA